MLKASGRAPVVLESSRRQGGGGWGSKQPDKIDLDNRPGTQDGKGCSISGISLTYRLSAQVKLYGTDPGIDRH